MTHSGRGAALDSIDDHGLTALMKASFSGQTGAVRVLLEAGAEVDLKDTKGVDGVNGCRQLWAGRCGASAAGGRDDQLEALCFLHIYSIYIVHLTC